MRKRFLMISLVTSALVSGWAVAVPNEKAERYHKLLLKKPGNTAIFSRFVDAWLDTASKEELKTWLEARAKAGGAKEWQVLASFHEFLGEDEEGLKALNEAIAKDTQNAGLRLSRAKLQARSLAFEAALDDLKIASQDDQVGIEASKLQGIYLARAGQIDEAVKAWKAVIERFPKDEELREDLIEVEVVEGLYDDAIATSQGLLKLTKDPYQKALRQLRLGDIQILSGQRKEGLATYQEIMAATAPDTWLEREVLAQIDRVFMREDDVQGLRDFYQKLRETHPRRVSIRKALARQMAANDEFEQAIALFREVLKITPGDLGNREEFIAFLESNRKWDEARAELQELLNQQKDDAQLWERMSRLEQKRKDPAGVKAALDRVRELRKGTSEGLIATAILIEQAELLDDAEALLREGRTTFPDSLEVTEALASFLVQNKKENEALALWTEMAMGADRQGLMRVARSLSAHGRGADAFALLMQRLVELKNDPLILNQITQLASSVEESEKAIPVALSLVDLAQTPTDLELAISSVARLSVRAKKGAEILADLEKNTAPSVAQLCLKASLYERTGDNIKANELLNLAAQKDEGLLAKFYRVRFDENREDFESAISGLRGILESPDGRKTVHMRRLVRLLERSGNLDAAIVTVDNWKKMAPGDRSAWVRRAELLTSQGNPDQAAVELRRMSAKFGNDEDSRSRLAAALFAAGEYRPAQRLYEQLYEEGEKLADKLRWVSELAKLAKQEGRLEELLADFDRRKRANPRSVAPLFAIAEIHREFHQYEERRSALLEASRRRPNDIELRLSIARVEERAGELDRAVSILKETVKLDPSPKTKRALAEMLLTNGEIMRGLRILREIPGEADDPRRVEKVVAALLVGGEAEAALSYLTDLLPRFSKDWRLQYLHGLTLLADMRIEMAYEAFAGLQHAGTELNGITPLLDGPNYLQQKEQYRNFMPPYAGWLDLALLSSPVEMQLRSVQSGNSGQNNFGSRAQGNLLTLPGSSREARLMSFLAVTSIAKKEGPEKVKEAIERVPLVGVEEVDFFIAISFDPENSSKAIEERLAKNPDDPFLNMMWFSLSMRGGQMPNEAKMVKALKIMSVKLPEISIMFLYGIKEAGQLEDRQIAEILEAVIQSTPADKEAEIFAMLASSLSEMKMSGSEMKGISDSLLQKALKVEVMPANDEWIAAVTKLTLQSGNAKDALTLLNRLGDWSLLRKKIVPLKGGMFGGMRSFSRSLGRRRSNAFGIPKFPPIGMKSVPDYLLELVAAKVTRGDLGISLKQGASSPLLDELLDEDQKTSAVDPVNHLKGWLDEIKSPILRAMAAYSLKEEEVLKNLIVEFAKSKDESELRFASGYLAEQKEYQSCYETLLLLRTFPLSRQARHSLDEALASVGAELVSVDGVDLEHARRAALRLRKVAMNDKLAPIMVKLGLEKEAEKLKLASVKSTSSKRMTSRRKSGNDLVTSLAEEGKMKEAAREAAKILRGILSQGRRNSRRRELLEIIEKYKLQDLILAKFDPGDSESNSRRLTYAEAASFFGRNEKAREIYESLLKERPDFAKARVGLFSVTPPEKWDFEELLKPGKGQMLAEVMKPLWDDAREEDEFPRLLALVDLTTKILEELPSGADDKITTNLLWVNYNAGRFCREKRFEEQTVIWLYGPSEPKKWNEQTKQRNEAVRKLFAAMLRHPQTAVQGFILMHGNRQVLGYGDEKLANEAAKVVPYDFKNLERKEPVDLWAEEGDGLGFSYFSSSISSSKLEEVSALKYLLRQGKMDEVYRDDLLKKLKKEAPVKYDRLLLARTLGMEKGEVAEAAFAAWKEKLPEGEKIRRQEAEELVKMVVLFKPQRGQWMTELQDLFLGDLRDDWTWGGDSVRTRLQWVRILESDDEVRAFLKAVVAKELAPEKKWPILRKLGSKGLPDPFDDRAGALENLFDAMLKEEDLVRPAFLFLAANDLQGVFDLSEYEYLKGLREDEIAWLKRTHILELQKGKSEDLAAQVLVVASLGRKAQRANFVKLASRIPKEESFHPVLAAVLTAHWLGEDEGRENMVALLNDNVALFKEIRATSESGLLELLEKFFPYLAPRNLNPEAKNFLRKVNERGQDVALEKAAELREWLKGDGPIGKVESLFETAYAVYPYDPKLTADLMVGILKHPNLSNGGYSSMSSEGVTVRGRDLVVWEFQQSLFQDYPGMTMRDVILLIDAVYRHPSKPLINELSGYGRRENMNYRMKGAWQELMKAFKPDSDSDIPREILLVQEMAKEMTPPQQATLMVMISHLIHSKEIQLKKDAVTILKWIDEELRKEQPIVADVLYSGLAVHADINKELHEPIMSRAKECLASFRSVANLPAPLILEFGCALCKYHDRLWFTEDPEFWSWYAEALKTYAVEDRNFDLLAITVPLKQLYYARFEGSENAAAELAKIASGFKLNPERNERSVKLEAAIFRLAIKGRDEKLTRLLFSKNKKSIQGNLGAMLGLSKMGLAKLATKLVMPPGKTYPVGDLDYWDPETKAAMEKLLEALPEASRFRVEVLLSNAKNHSERAKGMPSRIERLTALAKRFASEGPKVTEARLQVLAAFEPYLESGAFVKEEFAAEARRFTFKDAYAMDDMVIQKCLLEILHRVMFNEVEAGKYERIFRALDSLIDSNKGQEWRRRSAKIMGLAGQRIIRDASAGPEAARELFPRALSLLEKGMELERRSGPEVPATAGVIACLYAHIVAGEVEAWKEIVKNFKDHRIRYYQRIAKDHASKRTFQIFVNSTWPKDENASLRKKVAKTLLENSYFIDTYYDAVRDPQGMVTSGFLKDSELEEILVGISPDHQHYANYVFTRGWRAAERKQQEEAKAFFKEAQVLAEKKNNEALINNILSYRSYYLKMWGRIDEAIELGLKVDLEKIPKSEGAWFVSVRKELEALKK